MAVFTAVDDAGSFFNTVLYTGTGGVQTITGVGFSADLTWIKDRDVTKWHCLVDTLRGTDEYMYSNDGAAEANVTDRLTAWNSDGFVLGAGVETNTSSSTLVAWNWIGGTTSGITTDGSTTITPSAYSFNQTAGISIIKFAGNSTSGAKVAHGLGVVPTFMIVKNIDANDTWTTYTTTTGNTKYLVLNTTAATDTQTNRWNDTSPDSVNITLGNSTAVNNSGNNYLGLIFTDVQGYSKFGSYIGNGNADGPFAYTGFKPACLIRKRTDTTQDWYILDNKRLGYNPNNAYLFPNTTQTESDLTRVDFLSNGFKINTTDTGDNASGGTYIYIAFASDPFVNSEGVAGNSR